MTKINWHEDGVYQSKDGTRWKFICIAARDWLPVVLQMQDWAGMVCGFTEDGHYAASEIEHDRDIASEVVRLKPGELDRLLHEAHKEALRNQEQGINDASLSMPDGA